MTLTPNPPACLTSALTQFGADCPRAAAMAAIARAGSGIATRRLTARPAVPVRSKAV